MQNKLRTMVARQTLTATNTMECWRYFASLFPCWAVQPGPALNPRAADAARAVIEFLEKSEALPARAIRDARRLLEAGRAKSAAKALMAIKDAVKSCDAPQARGAVSAAERAARDVVVLCCVEPREVDHEAFVVAAEAAFGRRFRGDFLSAEDRELRSALLLAYHKLRRD